MARSRYTARVSRETPRRKFVWARTTATGTLGADSVFRTGLLDTFNSAYGADLLGATIVRIRGYLSVTGNVGDSGIFGVLVENESTAALTNADGPVHRPFADWMMFEPMLRVDSASELSNRIVDVKSARKIEELGQDAFLYFATSGGNVAILGYNLYLSIGLKLP